MKDQHEQGWNYLGSRLSDYRPSGDVDAGYEALNRLRQGTPAPATTAATSWVISKSALAALLVFSVLAISVGLFIFGDGNPSTSPAEDELNDLLAPNIPFRSIDSDVADAGPPPTPAAPTSRDVLDYDTQEPATQPNGTARKTTAKVAIQGGTLLSSNPDQASPARSSTTSLSTTTVSTESADAQSTAGGALPTLSGELTTTEGPSGSSGDGLDKRDVLSTAPLPTPGLGPVVTLRSPDEANALATSARDRMIATPSMEGIFKTRRSRISLAIGRQLNVGRGVGTSLADATYHGYFEYAYPVARRFGAGFRVGFTGYGGYQGTRAETIRENRREFISPLGHKVYFNQIEYADLAGSMDITLIATYRPAPRLTLQAGLRYSPTLYSVGIDADGLPSVPDEFSDIARISWNEFGGLAGLEYRVWDRFSAEVSYAPTFTRPINRVYPVGPLIDPVPYEELDLTAIKAALKVSF